MMKTTFRSLFCALVFLTHLFSIHAQDRITTRIDIDIANKILELNDLEYSFDSNEIKLELAANTAFKINDKDGYRFIKVTDEGDQKAYEVGSSATIGNSQALEYLMLSDAQFAQLEKADQPDLDSFVLKLTLQPVFQEAIPFKVSEAFIIDASLSDVLFFSPNTEDAIGDEDHFIVFDYLKDKANYNEKPLYKGVTVNNGKMVKLVFANFPETLNPSTIDYSFKDYHTEGAASFSALFGVGEEEAEEPGEVGENLTEEEKGIEYIDTAAVDLEQLFIKELLEQSTAYVATISKQGGLNLSGKADYECFKMQFKSYVDGVEEADIEVIKKVLLFFEASSEEIQKIVSNITYLKSHQSVVSVPIQIQDYDQFVVDVTYGTSGVNNKTLNYIYPIKGGFKLDFSTGLFCSFLTSDAYELIDAEDTEQGVAQKMVIAGTDDNFRTGIGILSHAYYRCGTYLNVAVSFGAVVENDVAVNWPVGLSLLLGRKSRVVLTGGMILGSADRLKSKYQVNQPYDASSLNGVTNDDLVTDVTRARPFLSLTYNFGSL